MSMPARRRIFVDLLFDCRGRGVSRMRSRVFYLVGALLGAAICFIAAAAGASALAHPHKAPTVVLAIVTAACTLGAAVLGRVAIGVEHRLRGGHMEVAPAESVSSPSVGHHPKDGPISGLTTSVVNVGLLVFLTFITVNLHAKAVRSVFTQHHGVSRTGTVESVRDIEHYSRAGSWHSYKYGVRLSAPVGAQIDTVVDDPTKGTQQFSSGNSISVLVDPHQLGYAEIPGQPSVSPFWFVAPLVTGAVFIGFIAFTSYERTRHRRRRSSAPTNGVAEVSQAT
jgi:hypothetical protein